MRQGETPTATRVAEVADVSRRTVYLYFPTQEQLLTEAALMGVRAEVERAVGLSNSDDVEERLDTLVVASLRSCIESEVLLRTMIRLTIERRLEEARGGPKRQAPLRGGWRIERIEEALEPVRQQLGEPRFERLVSAMALVVGIEALLVLRDIRGLDPAEIEDVSKWAAHALLQASLERDT
jgi:AcrR family transcriptional regulator